MTDAAGRGYSRAWRRATTVVFPPVVRAAMRRDWRGHEHIPGQGGVIMAVNHLSYADWAAVALFVHESGRYPSFLIKSSAFDKPVLGPFLRACGQLSVRRGQADAALVLKDAEVALREGQCLIFYPEGTASRDPAGWPMVAKTGVARLALSTGAPVIPLAHWGAQEVLPYGSKKPSLRPRHLVRMLAGPPVDLSAFAGQAASREALHAATTVIMGEVTALLAQLRGESPPAAPYDPAAARRGTGAASGPPRDEPPA